jgi:hypothetical protein
MHPVRLLPVEPPALQDAAGLGQPESQNRSACRLVDRGQGITLSFHLAGRD